MIECFNEILCLSFVFLPGFGDGSGSSDGSLCAFIPRLFLRRKRREKKNRIHSSSIADNKAHYVPRKISLRALNALAFFRYLALQKVNCILALQSAKVGPLRERGEYKKPTVTDCKEAIIEMEENCEESYAFNTS